MEKFPQVLVDPANGFVFCLDKIAFKKLSNNEVYEHVKKTFDEELAKKELTEINKKDDLIDKEKMIAHKKLHTTQQDFATSSN